MKEEYKKILPKWFEEQNENELVLSDDLDGLLSCAILNKVKGWKVRYFYDFDNLYKSNKICSEASKRVWVDVAVLNGEKAFDNHVSMVSLDDCPSENMINPNTMFWVTRDNYTDKYAGSTALLIWSLYDLPLPQTEEGKMLLLCVDSTYMGYFNLKFRGRNEFFLKEVLGLDELYRVQQRHTEDEFAELKIKYETERKITYGGGKLNTLLDVDRIGDTLGIKLDVLEDDRFILCNKFKICERTITREQKVSDISSDIFSLAFTYRNKVRFSVMQDKKEWLW